MRPKGKLFALLVVFAAIGLVTATGAFTTVQAERTAEVNVAGDANALVALEPADTKNGDAYASTPDGTLQLDLDGGEGASGVNQNAVTEVELVFDITNQGSQDVGVWIEKDGSNSQYVEFYDGSSMTDRIDNSSSNATTVSTGTTIQVSIKIDLRDAGLSDSDELLDGITIHAEESEA